ncbi:MAG: peptidoglycan bridge formation glycyltransferase FemA/FemB family protein, partial [Pseudomonadota bacterium]
MSKLDTVSKDFDQLAPGSPIPGGSLADDARDLVAFSVDLSSDLSKDIAPEISYLSSDEWNAFSEGFADIFHEQTAGYNDARWGTDRATYVKVSLDGVDIGGAAVTIIMAPVIKTGLAVLKWGPIWRKKGRDADPKHLSAIIQAIREEFAEKRGLYLTIMPRADADMPEAVVDCLVAQGFSKGDPLPAPTRYHVKVDQSADELRKSLAQKWRYNLKKAEKNDLEITFVRMHDGLAPFLDLYDQMLKRKGFTDRSAVHTLEEFIARAPESFQPAFVMARHEGDLCAAGVIDISGECAIYLYGATSDAALGLKAGYAMHWAVAERLCADDDVKWYDLGGNDLDKGLHQFKTGFVGKTGAELDCPPSYHYAGSWLSALLGRSVFAAREMKRAFDRWRSALSDR